MQPIKSRSPRVVEDELLDTLPYGDATSERIHKDIHRYNRILGHYRWMHRQLAKHLREGDRVLEIAAGRGKLLNVLASTGALKRASAVTAFDAVCDRPADLPDDMQWHICRAEDYTGYLEADVVIVCNFFHQLQNEALNKLGLELRNCRLILATETHRSPIAYRLCQLSRLIGFSAEGIGDGTKSLHAGFKGNELAEGLCLSPNEWKIQADASWLGRYRMCAIKQ